MAADKERPWELQDLSVDRTELHDPAATDPDQVQHLDAVFREWEELSRE